MSDLEHYNEIFKILRSPGGLKKTFANLLMCLLTDPDIRKEIIKDVNRMADVIIFFHGQKALFELLVPWSSYEPEELTRRWQHLLSTRSCGHLQLFNSCEVCWAELLKQHEQLTKEIEILKGLSK